MTVFADSSALVKLYVPEDRHDTVRAITDMMVIASLARVEVPAAFWGKVRSGELAAEDANVLVSAFEYDYHGDGHEGPKFAVVTCDEPTLVDAARRAAQHRLRAYDALQLSCAVAARRADSSVRTMAVFDRTLRNAAIAEGFEVLGGDDSSGPRQSQPVVHF